jgi:arginine/lysine/ornithine decarboxylase
LNQEEAPYFQALRDYVRQRNLTFHVPGHQHGLNAPEELTALLQEWGPACDITEVWGIDDIHDPQAQIQQAQQLAAELYGADQTYFLVNGSTVGNQAMFLSTLGPGKSVILPHSSHRSVYSALLLSGAAAHFFPTDFDPELLCSLPPTIEQAVEAMERFPDADALFLTSPTYHGALASLGPIVEEAHRRGKLVLVDEAWGSHLRFCEGQADAMSAGADLVVQSAHKMTSALTQGAYLHLQGGRIEPARVAAVLRHLQTSSPSSLLVASLDCARRQMALQGRQLWEQTNQLARELQQQISALPGLNCWGARKDWDSCRLIVQATELGYSGPRLEEELRTRFGIQVEMSELHQVLFLVTPGHDERHGRKLLDTLSALTPVDEGFEWLRTRDTLTELWRRNRILEAPGRTVRETFFYPASAVSLEKAVDQTSAELLYCYPPGVPFVYPGQRFSTEALELIKLGKRLGGSVKGGVDPNLDSVLVLQ